MSLGQPDEAEFLKLIEENRPKILKICRAYAWNPSDRDDLYQEILFQIWRALPGLKENAYAGTWLYRVALNTSISFVRKHAGRHRRATPCEPEDLTRQIESAQEACTYWLNQRMRRKKWLPLQQELEALLQNESEAGKVEEHPSAAAA